VDAADGLTPIRRHCEPFDAACGGAQDKLPLRGSEAIQSGLGAALDCRVASLLAMTI
jgi:hypothetical protein